MKDKNKIAMGKKSRAAGGRFELKVRVDLEKKGWIVAKWSNNVSLVFEQDIGEYVRELVKVKNKFLGPGRPMMLGAGFPDFIAFRMESIDTFDNGKKQKNWRIMGVESKMNGTLDKEEKEKCRWLLDKNIFGKILIAQKGLKRGEIIYKEFESSVV